MRKDSYLRAARVAALEAHGRILADPVGYVYRAFDADYRQEWPQSARDHAIHLIGECRMHLSEWPQTTYYGYRL